MGAFNLQGKLSTGCCWIPVTNGKTRRPMVAQRLRSVYIRPSFLPTQDLDDAPNIPIQSPPFVRRTWNAIKKPFKIPCLDSHELQTLESGPSYSEERVAEKMLQSFLAALPRFPHLEEVTIVLHNFLITPYFHQFLLKLWSITASRIRRLKLDVTLGKLLPLLEPLQEPQILLPILESFSLSFAVSRFTRLQTNTSDLCRRIASFIQSHSTTLRTLVISQSALLDLSPVFRELGYLPHLTSFELPISMDHSSLSEIGPLKVFLARHSAQLERLLLRRKPTDYFGSPSESDDTYGRFFDEVLPTLSFVRLSYLDIDCYSERPYYGPYAPPPDHALPPFRSFAPRLKKLALHSPDWYLNFNEVRALLNNLSTSDIELEYLSFCSHILSPVHLDELSTHLPRLRALNLTYEALGISPYRIMTASVSTSCPSLLICR